MTRKPDNPEEAFLLNALVELFGQENVTKPNRGKDGDVSTPGFQWEHKFRNTKGFTINWSHWLSIKSRAAARSKHPVLVIKNSEGVRLATIDLEVLLSLIRRTI